MNLLLLLPFLFIFLLQILILKILALQERGTAWPVFLGHTLSVLCVMMHS